MLDNMAGWIRNKRVHFQPWEDGEFGPFRLFSVLLGATFTPPLRDSRTILRKGIIVQDEYFSER